ncbi:MAG: hypothetical protein IJ737_01360 [Ruminococcus sp.]|nr:hypothetical protein [Ruminococcus sp.]MBR2282949.1 hypothetical protein [Ruminococcus sp.]
MESRHERFSKGLSFGLAGNLLFVLFGMICFVFYKTYVHESVHSRILEAAAYFTEFLGFGLFLYAAWLISTSVRMRTLFKVGLTAYVVLEAVMMVLELNSYRISFYAPYSLALAIVHSIVSAAVCLSFLQLDPDRGRFELFVIVCIGVILGGMLGNILGVRVYFSIITNAFGFALMFWSIKYLLGREEMEVDCYGDRAQAAEYTSNTLFEDSADNKKQ